MALDTETGRTDAPAGRGGAPPAVVLVAGILGIAAILSLVATAYFLAPGAFGIALDGLAPVAGFGVFLGAASFVAAVAEVAAAYGILTETRWGWFTGVSVAGAAVFVNLVGIFVGFVLVCVVGLLLAGLILAGLFTRSVLAWSGIEMAVFEASRTA